MALLTQPEAEAAIHGSIISKRLSVRHYCVTQLRTMWMHMRKNLSLLNNERSFLVMQCTKKLYEVCYWTLVILSIRYCTTMITYLLWMWYSMPQQAVV